MKPIQVGLLGIGTVGRGTFEVLQRNQEEIRRRAGRSIQIATVADLEPARGHRVGVGEIPGVADVRTGLSHAETHLVIRITGVY